MKRILASILAVSALIPFVVAQSTAPASGNWEDAENSRIQVFDSTGKFLEQWTGFSAKPRGSMFITADDTLYISHVESESISIMKNGKVIDSITGIGLRPHGLTMDRQGSLYVTGPLTQMVKKIVKK